MAVLPATSRLAATSASTPGGTGMACSAGARQNCAYPLSPAWPTTANTRWPTRFASTPVPTASTVPATSLPG